MCARVSTLDNVLEEKEEIFCFVSRRVFESIIVESLSFSTEVVVFVKKGKKGKKITL